MSEYILLVQLGPVTCVPGTKAAFTTHSHFDLPTSSGAPLEKDVG